MNADNEIMYDGVLYHLPIYQDEIVRNVIQANKEVEFHKDIEGYIILTNYRLVFMEKVKDLHYKLSNLIYYRDIISLKIGGTFNKYIKVNGVLFHPKDVSVEYIKKAIIKFTEDASKSSFSFQPLFEEESIKEAETYDESVFTESVNILISIFSIAIGIFIVLISAFWFYFGPHSRFPFVISLIGIVSSAILMGLVRLDKYLSNYTDEIFENLRNILILSIFTLILSSIGMNLDLYHSQDLTINCGRNNPLMLVFVVFFAILNVFAFKIGICYSKILQDPEDPFEDLNNEGLETIIGEKYHESSKKYLSALCILIGIQMTILIAYNVLSRGGIYAVFSYAFSPIPNPTDIRIFIPPPDFGIYNGVFLGATIAVGVFALVVASLIQFRNIGYLRFNILEIIRTINNRINEKTRYINELKIKIKTKTKRILQRMHDAFLADEHPRRTTQTRVEEIIPINEIKTETQSANSVPQTQEALIKTPTPAPAPTSKNNTSVKVPIQIKAIPEKIIGKITAKRGAIIKGSEFVYKIKVENMSNSVITDLRMIITSYPNDSMTIIGPEIQKRYKLGPGEMISPTFTFKPTGDCIIGKINSLVTYLNAKGEPNQINIEPYEIKLICGLLTPHSINAEEFNKIAKKLLDYSSAGEEIEFPYNAMTIYEKAKLILPHNNFHLVSAEDHLVAANFIGILKGFASGKFSNKKVGIQITINGKKDENFCVARIDGYTEDPSMLVPLLAEIKNEIRIWNCQQCGAQLLDSQIKQIMAGKTVRCRYCEEILQL
ncbi:MAG: hypothetical protein ACTSO9_14395 [Candidatus Helarchaeota archaeon]